MSWPSPVPQVHELAVVVQDDFFCHKNCLYTIGATHNFLLSVISRILNVNMGRSV